MKKALTLFMLSVILLTQTETYQLFKLAALVEHFSEHTSRNSGLSVREFLAEHYLQCGHDDNDRASDDELPFKKSESGLNTAPALVVPYAVQYNFLVPSCSSETTTAVSSGKTSASLQDIWQPPRFI